MQLLTNLFNLPLPTVPAFRVFSKNLSYFFQSFWFSILWLITEPIFYLFAIGYGIGSLIPQVNGQSYLSFYFPALLATSGMFHSFGECGYGSFHKLKRSKTYQLMMMTPIQPSDIAFGEILWASIKSLIGPLLVVLILGFNSASIKMSFLGPVFAVLFFSNWIFASLGLLVACLSNYTRRWFAWVQISVVIPMSLIGGTYFPTEVLPTGLRWISFLLPLTHTNIVIRKLIVGQVDYLVFLHLAVIFGFGFFLSSFATSLLSKKLFH